MKTKKIFAIALMTAVLLCMSLVPISSVSAEDVQEQILESYLKKDSVLTFEKDDSGIYLCGMPEKLTVSDLLTNIKKGAVLKNAAGEEKTGSDIVVTGDRLILPEGSDSVTPVYICVKGDLNGSGMINVTDYILLKRHMLGTYNLTGAFAEASDVDSDGKTDTTDILCMKRHFINISPIGALFRTIEDESTENGGAIVVYFSRTGHTEPLAEYIKDELNADIYEIEAKIPYTDDDIKYYTDCRADREQRDPSARPEIAGELPDLSKYDTVFLGYPIWHGQAPKIIYTFLESVDVSGKTIIPFCTSASSPVGSSADNLHSLAPDAVWKDGTRFAIGTTREEINEWLKQYDLKGMDDVKDDIEMTCVLVIEANGKIFYANFEDNSSAEAMKEKLNSEAITVDMHDYGSFEKVGALPWDLPRNDTQITTEPGDIILYQGNQITVYYDTNSWNFTRLARIGNTTKDELLAALGDGDVSVRFSLEWGE